MQTATKRYSSAVSEACKQVGDLYIAAAFSKLAALQPSCQCCRQLWCQRQRGIVRAEQQTKEKVPARGQAHACQCDAQQASSRSMLWQTASDALVACHLHRMLLRFQLTASAASTGFGTGGNGKVGPGGWPLEGLHQQGGGQKGEEQGAAGQGPARSLWECLPHNQHQLCAGVLWAVLCARQLR